MMKTLRAFFCLLTLAWAAMCLAAAQTVTLQGLRLANHRGSFRAAHYATDGSLLLLYDQGDGLRLLHTDAQAIHLLNEVQVGGPGDTGISMALDPAGNIYIAGTSSSGTLSGTQGAVFPTSADTSTNSFVAKFDANLQLVFLTFCGAGRTAVTGVAATPDAVFVTGATYTAAFPASQGAAQTAPADGSNGNGFVQRFSSDGSSLVYSTYLTGTDGDSTSLAIAADASDNAYIAGETSSAAFPSVLALRPTFSGSVSGFLAKLSPAGDAFSFSTFIPGSGLTSLDIDQETGTLLASGGVDPGRFPVMLAGAPWTNEPYQSLLRFSEDGQTLLQSSVLGPGTSSFVSAGPGGTAWVSGALGTPLPTMAGFGDSFLVHVAADGTVSASQRFGGLPTANAAHASITSSVGRPALTADGTAATLPATLSASVSADLAPTQHFDLPTNASDNKLLPNGLADLLPSSCNGFNQCTGSGGLLATVSLGSDPAASLSVSAGDLPNLTIRNQGVLAASGFTITPTGYSVATDCGSTLLPGAQCGIALGGAGPGTLELVSKNVGTLHEDLPATASMASALALDLAEMDFGAVTATSSPVNRTITVTNLSTMVQSFRSGPDDMPGTPPYTLAETASTCGGVAPAHTLAAGASCTLTLGLSASASAANDGPVRTAWQIGQRELTLTGITQAAAESVSSAVLDFGVTYAGAHAPLPLSVFLSNLSAQPVSHTAVAVPVSLPFQVTDSCPSTLEAGSVCQLLVSYTPAGVPATDSFFLQLDDGLNVTLTGTRLAQPVTSAAVTLSVSPASYAFADPVVVTGTSKDNGIVTVTNTGAFSLPVTATVTGDFQLQNNCGAVSPESSCTISLLFAPSQPGPRNGILSFSLGNSGPSLAVPITGLGTALLASDNGILQLGATPVGEPVFAWYKVAAPVHAFTASVRGTAFRLAMVEEKGFGHGTLPAAAFAPVVTGDCSNCWLGVAFVPTSSGSANETLTLTSGSGGSPYTLALSGAGLSITGAAFTPAAPDFGTVPVGSGSAPQQIELTNLLFPATPLAIQNIAASGDFKIVTTAGLPCVGSLASTASCFVSIVFSPTADGARTGTLRFSTDQGTFTVPLTGSGVPGTALGLSPLALNFSILDAAGAASQQQTLTLTNRSAYPLAIDAVRSSNASFVPSTLCGSLPSQASCTVVVQFTPGTSELTASLSVLYTVGEASGQLSPVQEVVPLAATYTADEIGLTLLPSEADFSDAQTGTLGMTRQFTLLNTSALAASITLSLPRQFPLATPANCSSLASGASCSFTVSFLPETGGAVTGSILATASSPNGLQAQAIGYLQGYGDAGGVLTVADAAVPGEALNFGVLSSGESSQQVLTLTDTGSGPVTVRRIQAAPPFFAQTDCGATLSQGASCTVTLTYVPGFQLSGASPDLAPRTDTETLLIESDAASSPDEIDLTGTVTPVVVSSPPGAVPLTSYSLSQGALTFANTSIDSRSEVQVLTLVNTGSTKLTVDAVQASPDFVEEDTCSAIEPAGTCTIAVYFAPKQAPSDGLRAGTLTVSSDAPDALEFVTLVGLSSPAPLTLLPASLDFGTLLLGTTRHLAATVTNAVSLPISFLTVASTGDYTVSPGTCPAGGASLAAGETCTLDVSFTPSAVGTRTGSLSLSTNATQAPLTATLTGVGTSPKLSVNPGSLLFGPLKLQGHASLPLNVMNSGTATLDRLATSITGVAASDFQVTVPCPTDTYTPLAGCTLQITFTPSAVGQRSANLVLSSSDPGSPTLIPLSGTGLLPSSFTLSVDGASQATATVAPGKPASFSLLLTPEDGFTGPVSMACAAITTGPYAGCAVEDASLMIGGGPQTSGATLTTLGPTRVTGFRIWALLVALPLAFSLRKRTAFSRLMLVLSVSIPLSISGCGGPGSSGQYVTPPGTYRYLVTATSIMQPTLTSAVTLTLVVH